MRNELSKEWERLIRLSGEIEYGRVEVIIQEGKPVRVEEAVKQVRLDGQGDDESFNIKKVT